MSQEPNLKIVGKVDLSKFSKKEKESVNHVIHDEHENPKEVVHFFQGDKGRIIGKLKSGKVAIVDKRARKGLVSENEDWLVEIVRDEQTICFVMPLEIIQDSKDNSTKIKNKAEKLKDNNWKVGKL